MPPPKKNKQQHICTLQKSFCMFSCGCLPYRRTIPSPSLPRWPAVSLSSPSSLKDYAEGHPLCLAIWKLSRGATLIGPEIAEETRWDWVGSGVGGVGGGVPEKVEGRLEGCVFCRFLYVLPCIWGRICALLRFKYFNRKGLPIATVSGDAWLLLVCFFGLFLCMTMELGFSPNGNSPP